MKRNVWLALLVGMLTLLPLSGANAGHHQPTQPPPSSPTPSPTSTPTPDETPPPSLAPTPVAGPIMVDQVGSTPAGDFVITGRTLGSNMVLTIIVKHDRPIPERGSIYYYDPATETGAQGEALVLGQAVVAPDGTFTATLPADIDAASVVVIATDPGGTVVATQEVALPGAAALARSGLGVELWMLLVALLLLTGVTALAFARRRNITR